MAITQVGTTVEQGITYGLSKWCDVLFSDGDWKPSELAKYSWCRWRDKYIGCCSATSTDIHTQQGPAVTQLLSYFNSSLSEASNNYVTYYNDDKIPTNEPYCFNILMYGRNGDLALTSDNAANYRVVTSCSDFQSLYVKVDRYQSAQSTINVSYPTARTVNCNNLLWTESGVYNTNNNTHTQWITVWTVFVIDEDNFFVTRGMAFPGRTPCMYDGVMGTAQGNIRPSNKLTIGYGNRITDSKWYYYYGDITNYQKSKHLLRWYKNGITGIEPQTWGNSKYGVYDVDDDVAIIMKSSNAVYGTMGIDYTYYLKSEEAVKNAIAYTGLRWKYQNGDTEHIYTPIIDGDGYITGYSTDPDAETKLNDITDVTGNNITPLPPIPPGPSEDDPSDDQAWGGAYSGAGAFSKFYLCTATDLANLRTWFGGGGGGDQIPDGFDPMGQVLGLLQYPISISGTALAPEEIIFRSGKTIVHTGVNADRSTGGFLHLDCGSVEIPRRMQQRGVPFLDFETSLEIYVPFCGTAPLDVQTCVGQTLTCDMYVATATGDVSAVIAAGGHPVAYMSGNMAESLPISSSGYGMYLAACKSTWGNGVSQTMNQLTGGATSTIKNTNQAALNETLSYTQTGGWGHSELIAESYNNPAVGRAMGGLASAKGAAALGIVTTAVNAIGTGSNAYEQYQRVKHASYTSVSGSFTSCAAWNYPFIPYVKITRPHQQIPQGDRGDYKHTAGIPLVETRTLSGAPGLTTCVNPDVSGIANATAQEKDIIYRALVNGVIV